MHWAGRMKYFILFVRMFEGTHMAFSGLDYFFAFLPPAHPLEPLAASYVDIITQMGLYTVVKVIESVAGLALVFNVCVPVALISAFVIDLNVFYLGAIVVHTRHQIMSSSRDLILDGILFAAYARYFLPITTIKAVPDGLWSILRAGGARGVNALRAPKRDFFIEGDY